MNLLNIESRTDFSDLRIARKNTALFLAFIFVQDIFWLVVSRITFYSTDAMFIVSDFKLIPFINILLFSLFLSFFCVVFSKISKPFPKIMVSSSVFTCIILLSVGINVLSFIILNDNARYIMGGLSGINGVIYFLSSSFNLLVMILFLRHNDFNGIFSKVLISTFILSLTLIFDGFATVLTMGLFIFLLLWTGVKSFKKTFFISAFMAVIAITLLIIGLKAKFPQGIPEYFNFSFFVRWAVARFSIQAEQAYTYFSGDSSIQGEYFSILQKSLTNRIDFIFNGVSEFENPKSLSAGLYYDMYNVYGSGSSPGLLLNTAMQGYCFFIPPLIFSFVFLQFFKGLKIDIGILQLISLSFLFKGVHANFSEYLVLISPTPFYLLFFILGCLITVKEKNK